MICIGYQELLPKKWKHSSNLSNLDFISDCNEHYTTKYLHARIRKSYHTASYIFPSIQTSRKRFSYIFSTLHMWCVHSDASNWNEIAQTIYLWTTRYSTRRLFDDRWRGNHIHMWIFTYGKLKRPPIGLYKHILIGIWYLCDTICSQFSKLSSNCVGWKHWW